MQLWDVATGTHRQTLEGHSGSVRSVAFSPDGQTLASASGDKTVRLWDVATGAHHQTLNLGLTQSLAFDPLSSTQLLTDSGTITLLSGSLANEAPTLKQSAVQPVINEFGLSPDKIWIMKDNERVIWLPPEYRLTASAVRGLMLCIGFDSGHVCWFVTLKQ